MPARRPGQVLAVAGRRFIPLGQVAKIRRNTGPSELASENGRLRLYVQANVQDRDLGGFVKEARERIAREIRLFRRSCEYARSTPPTMLNCQPSRGC